MDFFKLIEYITIAVAIETMTVYGNVVCFVRNPLDHDLHGVKSGVFIQFVVKPLVTLVGPLEVHTCSHRMAVLELNNQAYKRRTKPTASIARLVVFKDLYHFLKLTIKPFSF